MKRFSALLLIWWCCTSFTVLLAQTACAETVGTVQRERFTSNRLQQTIFYSVYLPPCYTQTTQVYPAVYLLHGSNENDEQWQRLGMIDALNAGIANGSLPPMILLMPYGDVIANRNRFDDASWANIFLYEFMPLVESNYRVDARPQGRVLAGISRGGFWAFHIGFLHPGLFGTLAGHSGFFDDDHVPPDVNPLDLALTAPNIETQHIWLDRGKDDYAAPGLDLMHERLTQRGIAHTYQVYPEGQHYYTYWEQHVGEYLAFYAASLQAEVVSIPVSTATAAPILAFATNTPVGIAPNPTLPPAETVVAANTAVSTLVPVTEGYQLYVPAVAFPSLQTSITAARLKAIAQGELDAQLILTPEVLAALPTIHPNTRTVPAEAVRQTLWKERTLVALLPFDQLTTDYRVLWVEDMPLWDQLASYPFALPSSTPNFSPDLLTRLTMSGVTALTRNTRTALSEKGVAWAASGIQEYVTRSDFFHTSNEVSIYPTCPTTTEPTLGGSSSMCSLPDHFELLRLLDVDIVELTGNHNNDYGYQAYLDTLAFYQTNQMSTIGGGATPDAARQPLLLEYHGSTIGLVACNVPGPYYAQVSADPNSLGGVRPGAAPCDWAWLETTLPQLAQTVDVLVVTIQYTEYEDYQPTNQQRYDYRRLADWGADVVLGTAEHKPQTFEFYDAGRTNPTFIHYGMGNLFFDQPFWGNMRFFMDTLLVYEGRLMSVELFPGIIEENARPRLMTPTERENFLFFLFVQQNGF